MQEGEHQNPERSVSLTAEAAPVGRDAGKVVAGCNRNGAAHFKRKMCFFMNHTVK